MGPLHGAGYKPEECTVPAERTVPQYVTQLAHPHHSRSQVLSLQSRVLRGMFFTLHGSGQERAGSRSSRKRTALLQSR